MHRSRGKGNRRVPWRDGGATRQRRAAWVSRATHAVEESGYLGAGLVEIDLWSMERPEACIYRFDQIAARGGWRYHAELVSSGPSTFFRVLVAHDHEQSARCAAEAARRM